MEKPGFMVVGTASGVGKTTITRGLIASLRHRGKSVQSYKLGPDYIDAGHHAQLTGRPCVNLDSFLLTPCGRESEHSVFLREELYSVATDADVIIVEAAGGLYDDWYRDGTSPAALAVALELPVVLVVDGFASCQTLGVAINALLKHDSKVNFAGLIVTKVSSEEHYIRIVEAVEPDLRQWLLGFLPGMAELFVEERHLGLLTAAETTSWDAKKTHEIAVIFENHLNVSRLLSSATTVIEPVRERKSTKVPTCRIGVAQDQAFSFYYEYNLRLLSTLGAELVPVSPLSAETLPDGLDALYIGGGFPEVHALELSRNERFMESLRGQVESGIPIYAECGGLMYLCRSIQDPKTRIVYPSVGVFPFDVVFDDVLKLAYTFVVLHAECLIGGPGDIYKAHVFHRTALKGDASIHQCGKVVNINSPDGSEMSTAHSYRNVFASYAHAHFRSSNTIAQRLVDAANHYKELRKESLL